MNVLSLFNGMSFGKIALESLDIKVTKYYSSEIDKYANQATQTLFPDTIQLGDITQWRDWDVDWASIDLVTGGFPCQAWSMAGKQLGDKDERGMLFWTMLDIMKHIQSVNPKVNFMIENVKMKKEFEEYITTHTENALGEVYKILINSALVSAQNRNRYYWTSFEVNQPVDKGVLLKDIIEHETDKKFKLTETCVNRLSKYNNSEKMLGKSDKSLCLIAGYHKMGRDNTYIKYKILHDLYDQYPAPIKQSIMNLNDNDRVKAVTENDRGYRPHKNDASKSGISELGRILKNEADKTDTVTTSHMPKLAVNADIKNLHYRKLTPRECFRLQTVPEHYIDTLLNAGISNTQLYKMCGNGWTMEVIAHIFKGLK